MLAVALAAAGRSGKPRYPRPGRTAADGLLPQGTLGELAVLLGREDGAAARFALAEGIAERWDSPLGRPDTV
ncbi:hypothetical protein [Streptomyces erythrochromogenes]|uniref:hypothetical protein n=1 Tax=Streptomyces erythrochromogenes TaxID=285574 RepID=UPI000A7BB3EB|nr:hypothetical protein [Streptomyces erythrochromogenes]MCX5581874.1 hypothetical protein [Streptomyces erythrochromogenes]